ncbi:MAG: VWA domain-containing protein [Dehalococcoidales bacterium]|mgnify:CR=1 FL=1|jgi:uncharacterized protein with von Willebrand factor type A (vWA) domain|nr:hypothetical protein [Dehalococcoidales bacterium]MDP6633134.1 VWA domain-containing protein [Dehalococcoidales bacterium]
MNQITIEYCNRCNLKVENDSDLLREIAYNEDRYLADLLKRAQEDEDNSLHKEATEQMKQRLKEPLPEIDLPEGEEDDEPTEGMFQTDDDDEEPSDEMGSPKQETDEINEDDVRKALEEYARNGEISFQNGKVTVTPKGVKKLAANALERILKKLSQKGVGIHAAEKVGFGVDLSLHTRAYELGDDYSSANMERTLLNTLSRAGDLRFEPEDFEMHEEIQQSKLCAGIIIDESGSMRDARKLSAAMETALVLSKLIQREPENTLKVFVFSDEVKQIEPWAIVNKVISGGDTDIKAALGAFRRTVRHETGDKQVYLITDTEPNLEEGMHIPFEKAAAGLLEEASRYRQEKIGLNIIMLDEGPELKELAATLAKRNLGRVFFTSPVNLGEVLVQDYLKSRGESASSAAS